MLHVGVRAPHMLACACVGRFIVVSGCPTWQDISYADDAYIHTHNKFENENVYNNFMNCMQNCLPPWCVWKVARACLHN